MAVNNRVCLMPSLNGFRTSPTSYYGTAAAGTAASSGPVGQATMSFFCVVTPDGASSGVNQQLFSRSNIANNGWGFYRTGAGLLRAFVANATPAAVEVSATPTSFEGFDVPYIMLASYQNGVLTLWLNGVLVGTTTLGNGFTALANRPTAIGASPNASGNYAANAIIGDSGMLYGYDPTTFVSTLYGNGAAGLNAMWLDDLRNGRYLTWPRAAVVNQDWYWAARDAVAGLGSVPSWVDRLSATAMLRFGSPQGASIPARPL